MLLGGFMPAGGVSSSSTLHIFWDESHSWWLLCQPVCLLGHFPWPQRVQDCTWAIIHSESGHQTESTSHESLTSQSRCFTFLWQAPWLSENGNVCPGCHPSRPPVAKNVELLGCLRFQAGRTISTRQIERRYVSDCYETSTECISDRLLYWHKVTLWNWN